MEFGFNDTPLTRALESGNYALAEKIIRDNVNPSALDEGMLNCLLFISYKFVKYEMNSKSESCGAFLSGKEKIEVQ